jgi:hypothetical protein
VTARPGPTPIGPASPQRAEEPRASADREGWWQEVNSLDLAVYAAIAATPTPSLDRVFRRLSRAADHSKLWLSTAAVLATVGGTGGRRAAVNGLASLAVTSAVVNLLLKPLGRRHRPDRASYDVPITRQVTMPRTTSFPSGHAASASAFATGVATASPQAGRPLPHRRHSGHAHGRDAGAVHGRRARAPSGPTAQRLNLRLSHTHAGPPHGILGP